MTIHNAVKFFNTGKIRSVWDDEKEEWYYSVVDVVGILTNSVDPGAYWRKLKQRLLAEGSQVVTFCHGLKLPAPDGKMRLTDVADTEQMFRIIQSIPSPKAEPFKQWLAQVGKERLEEVEDPELAIQRALMTYRRKGYSEDWINLRLKAIEARKDLTDEWNRSGVSSGFEYATLTDIISKGWSGMTTKEYKRHKGLTKQNLRDNMSNMEMVLNMLAEVTTTELSKSRNPQGFDESKKVAREGGEIVGNTRREIESKTGRKVVSAENKLNQPRGLTKQNEK